MPKFTVKVKWGKEIFKDVEVNTDEDPDAFRGQLFSLTGVSPEGQKIMCKGVTLKDTWEKFPIKNKASILLMGTAGELPEEPEEVQFADDLPTSAVVTHYPAGLKNFGNTCYMNAALQCIKTAPALADLIKRGRVGGDGAAALVPALRAIYATMDDDKDRSGLDAAVMRFLMLLRQINPQFAETQQGQPAQQDAGDFLKTLSRALDTSIQPPPPADTDTDTTAATSSSSSSSSPSSFARGGPMSQFFGVDRRDRLTCEEAPEEEASVKTTRELDLSCHIDKDVGFVMAGLKRAMEEEITKLSPTLGRDAIYKKQSLVSRLPAYLTVNLVRFYFKQSTQENCKIRKDVKFPLKLDVYDICTPELQQKLKPARAKFAEYQDWDADNQAMLAGKRSKGSEEGSNDEDDTKYHPTEFEDDVGSNNSGYYELRAVLTHRGSSSNSGHYVAWIKQRDNLWYLMDDDKVTPKKDADILALSGAGGADWHVAYILFYAAQRCPVIPEAKQGAGEDDMDTGKDADGEEATSTSAKAAE